MPKFTVILSDDDGKELARYDRYVEQDLVNHAEAEWYGGEILRPAYEVFQDWVSEWIEEARDDLVTKILSE